MTFGKPGQRLYRTLLAARLKAQGHNAERPLQHALRRPSEPEVMVYAVYVRRKKDAYHNKGTWSLIRKTRHQKLSDDDVRAYVMMEKLKKARIE